MRAAVILCVVLLVVAVTAQAQVPRTISYQGVLRDLDGNTVPDGLYDMTFVLTTNPYGDCSDGVELWSELQPVSLDNGLFNVKLGTVTPLDPGLVDFSEPYCLRVEIGGTEVYFDELVSVPYALNASDVGAQTWDNVAGDVLLAAPGHVGIHDDTPEWSLDIHEPSASNNYMQFTNSVTGDAMWTGLIVGVSGTGDAWISQGSAHGLHLGHGASATSINVFPDGDVAIGLISDPDDKLEVAGSVEMEGFKMPPGAIEGYVLTCDAAGMGTWQPTLAAPPGSASGSVTLDANGEARVAVQASLGTDLLYQLTCVGGYAPVYVAEKVSGGTFVIAGGEPGLEVSWQVTAE
jgi:hypothetical protein